MRLLGLVAVPAIVACGNVGHDDWQAGVNSVMGPESAARAERVIRIGTACGMKQVGLSVDFLTRAESLTFNPMEEGIDHKLRCLDEGMRQDAAAAPHSSERK